MVVSQLTLLALQMNDSNVRVRKLGSWLKASTQQQEQLNSAARTPEARVKEEVEQYSNIVKPDPESNPLDWWKIQAPNYPVLAKLAKKYLCICASSSASERLFIPLGTLLLRSILCLNLTN